MYHILLVDDELPALRFLETIVKRYAPEFTVACSQRDGSSALAWLKEHVDEVDLILTDIRMPDMDGISLAKAARALRKDLHIVIVSGYQEFEYAHGAIEASVDDYILKPVSVSHMKKLLEKIRLQLEESRNTRLSQELTALLNGRGFDSTFLNQVFGFGQYYFALLRFGNVIYPQEPLTHARLLNPAQTALLPSTEGQIPSVSAPDASQTALLPFSEGQFPEHLQMITGRDEQEYLIFAPSVGAAATFQGNVRDLAAASPEDCKKTLSGRLSGRLSGNSPGSMATVIFAQGAMPFVLLKDFYPLASKALRHTAVIGQYAELTLSSSDTSAATSRDKIAPTILKRLELCIQEGDFHSIRKIFRDLGMEWEQKGITQRQSYVMMQQLLHQAEALRGSDTYSTAELMLEADQLTNTAASYSELTERLFQLLFEDPDVPAHPMRPEEMYQYAVSCIEEKFAQPISIQTVCSEIGISQTYLSRLFRRYGNTSFNACLIQCRMDNAKQLLLTQPDMPLYQVAACVGYEDYAYFSKVFRQATGYSPSRYQESMGKQEEQPGK